MFNTLTNIFIKKQSNLFFRSIGVAFFFFASACTMDAKIENTAEPASSVNSPALPAAPTPLTLVTPSSSPGNNASPTIRVAGLANGDTVKLYSDVNCTIVISTVTATGSTYDFALGPLTAGVYNYYATRTTTAGTSSCSSSTVQYVLDLTAPSAPSGLALQSPASTPANDSTPTITVSGVTSGDTIKLFSDSACTTQVGSATASGTSVNVTSSTLTQGTYGFYANATDPAGNVSTCSTATVAYDLDLTAPSAPSGLSLSNPTSSPGTEASPTINVTGVVSGDTIKLFSDSSCTTQVATGAASATSISLTLSSALTLEGTYNYYANATDPVGNVSSCSTATVTYVFYTNSYVTVDPSVQFVNEGNASASFTVKISTAKTYPVTLSYNLSGSTAIHSEHHDLVAGTVTIPANQTQVSISFNTLENSNGPNAGIGAKTLQLNIVGSDRFEASIGNPNTGMPAIGKMHIDDNDITATTVNEVAVYSDYANPYSRWCVINSNNALKCWGGALAAIGDGSLSTRTSPVIIDSGTGFSKVALDLYGGMALTTAGKVKVWTYGGTSDASAGDGSTTQRLSPVIIDSATNYSSIYTSAASGSKCAISTAGVLKCWGYNYGVLGDGTTTSRTSPVVIDSGTSYSSLAMGAYTRCGITATGVLKCWGANGVGQVGNGTTADQASPVIIDSGVSYSNVFRPINWTVSNTCAITSSGVLKCWGDNMNGQLGDGSTNSSLSPLVVDSGTTYSKIAFSNTGSMICGLTTGQKIKCWGNNDLIDNGVATGTVRTPTLVDSGETYLHLTSLDHGTNQSMDAFCGITSSNKAKCWGYGYYNNLAFSPNNTDIKVPTDVSNGLSIAAVTLGDASTCFTTTTGKLLCTGINTSGQLGLGYQEIKPHAIDDAVTYSKIIATGSRAFYLLSSAGKIKHLDFATMSQSGHPVTLDENNTYSSVSPASNSACGITSAGALYCNSGTAKFSLMDSGTSYSSVSSSPDATHYCGLTTANVLKCWGSNSYSELGDGTTTTRNSPTVVDVGTSYTTITVTENSTCGITSTGALKCWGQNGYGQIGDNTTTAKTIPTLIDSGTNYSSIAKSRDSTCGITSSGALKCWGSNTFYSLGDGTTTKRLIPTLINSGTNYSQVILNPLMHGCGITTANALKCWGYNNYYLGTADTANKPSPTLVNSGTGYTKMSRFYTNGLSGHQNCAITTTGVLKCWGLNFWGEVGNGFLSGVNSPTIVDSGVNYSEIATSTYYTCGITTTGILKCWGGGQQVTPSQSTSKILMSMVPDLDN